MTKTATMTIYDKKKKKKKKKKKNLQKSSVSRLHWNLVSNIVDIGPLQFVQMMTGLTLTYFKSR